MPRWLTALVLAAVLAMAAAAASGAWAQQAPTLGAPSPEETAPVPTTTSTTSGGGLKAWQTALIIGAGGLLLAGIAFAILGDARERVATAAARRGRSARPAAEEDPVVHRHRQQAKERARAKAKAARRQRRHNR